MTIKKRSFEETLKQLETVTEDLKSGNLTLDQSIKSFDLGVKLYEECNDILSEAKQKIEVFES